MHNKCVALCGFILFLVAAECAASPSPTEVAEGFWEAVKQQDADAVSKYVTAESLITLEQQAPDWNVLLINQATLGGVEIDGDRAWIDAMVEIADDVPFQVPVETVLLQENLQWKVDYNATVASITYDSSIGRVLGELGLLGRQFTDELNQSLEEVQKALPEIEREIGKIEEDLKHTLPELRQRMEELIRQLENALGGRENPDPDPDPELESESPPSPRTREI